MLNEAKQIEAANALSAAYGKDLGGLDAFEYETITTTRDTVADFVATRGKANETVDSSGITVSIWRESQAHKGDRRHDVFVADMGDCRAVYVF